MMGWRRAGRAVTPTMAPPVGSAERRAALAAFSRALSREAHNLQAADLERFPAFVFQQLYNRLQWEEEPVQRVLEPAFRERTRPGSGLWFHEKTPLRESGGLVAALASPAHAPERV